MAEEIVKIEPTGPECTGRAVLVEEIHEGQTFKISTQGTNDMEVLVWLQLAISTISAKIQAAAQRQIIPGDVRQFRHPRNH